MQTEIYEWRVIEVGTDRGHGVASDSEMCRINREMNKQAKKTNEIQEYYWVSLKS